MIIMDLKTALDTIQEQINKEYEEKGVNDEIINVQVSVNTLRNHFNIPDETKLTESNKGFVQ